MPDSGGAPQPYQPAYCVRCGADIEADCECEDVCWDCGSPTCWGDCYEDDDYWGDEPDDYD